MRLGHAYFLVMGIGLAASMLVILASLPPAELVSARTRQRTFRVQASGHGRQTFPRKRLDGGLQFGGSGMGERLAVDWKHATVGVEVGQPAQASRRAWARLTLNTPHMTLLPSGLMCARLRRRRKAPGVGEGRSRRCRVCGRGRRQPAAPSAGKPSSSPSWTSRSIRGVDHRSLGRDLAHDLVVDGPFPVGQVRCWSGRPGADERGVGVVGEHLHLALIGDVGCGPDVIKAWKCAQH